LNESVGRAPSLRCPACKRSSLSPAGGGVRSAVRCPGCGASYPVTGGLIDLLTARVPPGRSFAQFLMEWEPVIRIYESRWWRRSPLFALYAGISFEREYELVCAAANLRDDALLLDLACGSGIYARPLARRLSRGWVVGLDRSAPMLRSCRGRADARGIRNMTLVRGDARSLPFEDGTFHAVTCCGALHLFPEVERVLAEIHRVLRPGSTLAAAVFGTPAGRPGRRLAAAGLRGLGARSFDPDRLRNRMLAAGFRRAEVLHRREGRGWMVVSASR